MDITTILLAAQSIDNNTRQAATQQLQSIEHGNFSDYMSALCNELANPSKPAEAQQLAGLLLKNAIFLKDQQRNSELTQRWLVLSEEVRKHIKITVLTTLASPVRVGRATAALVVGKLAAIEIPRHLWPDLVDLLLHNIHNAPNVDLKQATFEALGYVCEEVPTELHEKSGGILVAIASGMNQSETDTAVKFAATVALVNSLEFIKKNMEVDNDRRLIIQMIFSTTTSPDEKTRMASYQCLCELARLYYIFLEPFIGELFNVTSNAIKNEIEGVALQAIEFWSTICDAELTIVSEAEEAGTRQQQPTRVSGAFAKRALQGLLPLMLECLTQQSEDLDDDTWTKSMAAGSCLGLLAQSVQSDVVQPPSPVLPFIEANIQNANWRFKEAAVMAFGSILDGPDEATVRELVTKALPLIIAQIGDENPLVKDTVAWTLGRICDICPETIEESQLPTVMRAFELGLRDDPKIASSICYAIHSLAEAVCVDDDDETSLLSPYVQGLASALLGSTERNDISNSNLLVSAYEALTALLKNSAPDCQPVLFSLLPAMSERLKQTFIQSAGQPDQAQKQLQLQGLICCVLQAIIEKTPASSLEVRSDELMMLLLEVLKSSSTTLHEESLLAISAVCSTLGASFVKYVPALLPFLLAGLRSYQESMVCTVAVGLVTELCGALGHDVLAIGNEVVNALLANLQNSSIHRDVKPAIISCLGDVAMAVGGDFERYLPFVMMMLVSASQTQFESMSWDNIDYLNSLRHSIIEAYTGIIIGLCDDSKGYLYIQFADPILGLLTVVANDPHTEKEVYHVAIGLIRDIADKLGVSLADKLRANSQTLLKILQRGLDSSNSQRTKDNATTAMNILKTLLR